MSYIDRNLVDGESVTYETRLHWIVMLGHLLLALLMLGVVAVLLYVGWQHRTASGGWPVWQRGIAIALGAGALLVLFSGTLRRYSTEMAVTTRRVVVKKGLLSRSTIEMLLNKIESIEVRESFLGRLLGFGTVVLIGTGGSSEPFRNMAHPLAFRREVQRQLESQGSAPTGVSAAPSTTGV